jgi:Cytochrome P450
VPARCACVPTPTNEVLSQLTGRSGSELLEVACVQLTYPSVGGVVCPEGVDCVGVQVHCVGDGHARAPDQHVAGLIEESLRFEGTVQFTLRTALDEIGIDDQTVLPKGATAMLAIGGANRDPNQFEKPNVFDITRSNARDHLAFSSGVHYCVGASLARLEAEIAWKVLLERSPGLRLAGKPSYRPSPIIRGLSTLPVRLG